MAFEFVPILVRNAPRVLLLVAIVFGTSYYMNFLAHQCAIRFHQQSTNESTKTEQFRLPTNLDELRDLSARLQTLNRDHSWFVLLFFSSAYLVKQTFAIPGSVLLNLLAGSLFGLYRGLALCCTLTTLGASFCFLLSRICGEQLIVSLFSRRLNYIRNKTENLDSFSLFTYLLFARLFPVTPNWLLNIVSPILKVPWHLFAASVFFGLIPYNYICVQTGEILTELTSTQQLMNTQMLIKLLAIAVVALVPSLLIQKWNKSREDSKAGSYFGTEQTKQGQTVVRRSARLRAKID